MKNKWRWPLDQWFEDKVWARVPKDVASPHFFFVLGFIVGSVFVILLSLML